MVDQIFTGAKNYRKYIPNKIDKTIFMYRIQFLESQRAVAILKNKFFTGTDGMSTSLLK